MARPETVALVAVCIGAVLRFATISSQSLWYDESLTAHDVTLSFGGLLGVIGPHEASPPLYFTLAWLWAKVFGAGEAGLRSLSAVLGVATIWLAFLSGRELVSRRAGAVAAALVAISPLMIWYSQEAREYALLAAMSAASLLFFARTWNGPGSRNVVWWAVFSVLALLAHFFAAFLVAPEGALLLWRHRSRAVLVGCAAVALVGLALIPLAVSDTGHGELISWIGAFPLGTRIQQVPIALAANTLDRSSAVSYALPLAGLVLAVIVLQLIAGASSAQLRGAGIAGLIAASVLLLPLVAALLGSDYYIARALIGAYVPLAIVVGAAGTTDRLKIAGAVLIAVALVGQVLAGIAIAGNRDYQRPDWRGVAAAVGPRTAAARAIVAYDGSLASHPLAYYLPGVAWNPSPAAVRVAEIDLVTSELVTPERLPAGVHLLARRSVAGYEVSRYGLTTPWQLTPAQLGLRAGALLTPAPVSPAVLIQPGRG